jgi:hypothetical protein
LGGLGVVTHNQGKQQALAFGQVRHGTFSFF